jgi:membrane protease YdiL (CAAX protease family)
MLTGLFLGGLNTFVILWIVPILGGDLIFLRETPHAKVPTWIMVPWGILLIAALVELNFRGFLLGRLQRVFGKWFSEISSGFHSAGSLLAVVSSALVFAFDPFMVSTFRYLHWIAVWDGLIWGVILVRTRNLYAVVVAHAVEVMILYVSIKAVLT